MRTFMLAAVLACMAGSASAQDAVTQAIRELQAACKINPKSEDSAKACFKVGEAQGRHTPESIRQHCARVNNGCGGI